MEQWAITWVVVAVRGWIESVGNRRGLVLVVGAFWAGACTESGQILTLVEDHDGSASSGGMGGNTGGDSGSSGGAPNDSGGTDSGGGNSGGAASGGAAAGGSGGMADMMGGAPGLVPGPTGTTVVVDSGDAHTCGVIDGTLYCWGDNQSGALGLDDFESRTTPTAVGTELGWTAVGAGGDFTCALRNGVVWCFGGGSSGQLGAGEFTSSAVPLEVSLPSSAEVISVGSEHACVILDDGRLYCWGQNTEGQLAQEDPWTGPGVNSAVPLPVAPGETFVQVSTGQGHTCAIRADGTLWCWGRNTSGELGLGEGSAGQLRLPAQVGSSADWEHIAAGQGHTCGIRSGELYCWGVNSAGQLGVALEGPVFDPELVVGVVDPASVSVDTFHTCAIRIDGSLLCWGRNIEGQLGDGTIDAKDVPTPALPVDAWDLVSAGRFHTCGVRQGAVLCTGENQPGRLGTGDTERRREFTETAYFP